MTEHEQLFWPLAVVFLLGGLALIGWVALENYGECRATPHTVLYCLTSGG